MRLSLFIQSHIELILAEWGSFARGNAPADSELSAAVLRDHAREMLLSIAADMETVQSAEQQKRKSQGLAGGPQGRSAATTHGEQRQQNEYSFVQVGAEFRALRATVLRLWVPHVGPIWDKGTEVVNLV